MLSLYQTLLYFSISLKHELHTLLHIFFSIHQLILNMESLVSLWFIGVPTPNEMLLFLAKFFEESIATMVVHCFICQFFYRRYVQVTPNTVLHTALTCHWSGPLAHEFLRTIHRIQNILLKILQKVVSFTKFDIVRCSDTNYCICIYILVCERSFRIQRYFFLSPLDKVRMSGEHNILKTSKITICCSLAPNTNDSFPVDEAGVLDWHFDNGVCRQINIQDLYKIILMSSNK